MNNKKNILIINDSGIAGSGGAENRIRILIDEMLLRKYYGEVHIMHMDKYHQPFYENIYFHPVNYNKKNTYITVKNIIKKHNIDIVQVHNILTIYPVVVLAAKAEKKTVIWFVHDFWALCGLRSFVNPYESRGKKVCISPGTLKCIKCLGVKGYIRQKMMTHIMNKVDIAIVPAYFAKKIFIKNKFLKEKTRVVHPWLKFETDKYLKQDIKREDFTILFVGSLLEYKGAWQIVKTLKKISEVFPQTRLKIIGSNQDKNDDARKKIDSLAKEEGVLDKIDFLGHINGTEIINHYKKAAVLVFLSTCMEIFGQVWAEALLFGCPVIASNIGGPSEFLNDYGLLYPVQDVEKLSGSVTEIFKNKDMYLEKTNAGKKFVIENFNIKKSADEIIKIYEEVK